LAASSSARKGRSGLSAPTFLSAIDPCAGCDHARLCSSAAQACQAFHAYSNGASVKTWRALHFRPSREWYAKVYADHLEQQGD